MEFPSSSSIFPDSDAVQEVTGSVESNASSAMRLDSETKWDTKAANAMNLDQPRLSPRSLQRQSSPRGRSGSAMRSGLPAEEAQTAPVVAPRPKAAGTVLFWKEPSRGAKRRAKAAAAAKTAAVSPHVPILPAPNLMSGVLAENRTQSIRGTSYSDEDADSDDKDLPDLSGVPPSDVQGALYEIAPAAAAPFAHPFEQLHHRNRRM